MTPEREAVWDTVLGYLEERAREQGNPVHIDLEPPIIRARLTGEARDFITIWFTVGERTLHYETYFMPGPQQNHEAVYRFLMRWNRRLYLSSFALDPDGEVYISGRLPLSAVTATEVDRVTGQLYWAVESVFRTALRMGIPGVP